MSTTAWTMAGRLKSGRLYVVAPWEGETEYVLRFERSAARGWCRFVDPKTLRPIDHPRNAVVREVVESERASNLPALSNAKEDRS